MVHTIISRQQLSRNRQAMGVASIDSTEIVTRLRLHVAIVSGQYCHYIKLSIKFSSCNVNWRAIKHSMGVLSFYCYHQIHHLT